MPDITYDVGRISFVMKGAWNLATAYEKLDAVTYDGSLYIAKQDVPGGTAITNTTYWQLAAEKGDQGETGNGIASIAKTGTAGNVDTYTITYTDGTTTTFTVTNGGVTTVNGRTGDVTGLAEEDGSYPLLNAGTADNLTPYSEDSGATQSIPFIAQGTGCGNGESVVDTGSYLQFKKKLGNTAGVNQFVPTNKINFSGTGDGSWWILSDNFSAISGHIYLIFLTGSIPMGSLFRIRDATQGWVGSQQGSSFIWTAPGNSTATTALQHNIPTGLAYNINHTIHDLTLWYGSNDRIPSDLLSHPENWGRYYAGSLDYNAGTLDSADGAVMRSIGRNAWNEDWYAMSGNQIGSNSFSECIPGATYFVYCGTYTTSPYFVNILFFDKDKVAIGGNNWKANQTVVAPINARYFKIQTNWQSYVYGATYLNDITVSLYYPGESGYDTYYPYSVLAEVDTGSEVLRSAGAVADEKTPDGTITRRVGAVDLGTLTYTRTGSGLFQTNDLMSLAKPVPTSSTVGNIRSASYIAMDSANITGPDGGTPSPNMVMAINASAIVYLNNTAYTDAATFKTAMSGIYLYYELATPTTEQGTAFAENIPCDDFGSMYWTQTKGIPQGNEIFYPVDYKASIDTLYNRVEGDMSKIVTEDEYPEAPSSDGTYVLKATVSGGTKTYAWVAE